jgi:hypothetical protein
MITIEQARKKLSKKYEKYSDEQIQKILDFFYSVAYSVVNLDDN